MTSQLSAVMGARVIPDVPREALLTAMETYDRDERQDDAWPENQAHRYAISQGSRR